MSDTFSQKHRVEELRYVSAERRLEVAFEDGKRGPARSRSSRAGDTWAS
jgi:hypothetical protein